MTKLLLKRTVGIKPPSGKKADIVSAVSSSLGTSEADSVLIVDAVLEAIGNIVRDKGALKISGFGSFSVSVVPSRPGRNPRTGEAVAIPEGRRIVFSSSNRLKMKIRGELT